MNRHEIKEFLKTVARTTTWEKVDDWLNESSYQTIYLGSFMYLDPCGRYHHILSPNGMTKRCERFWENLDDIAENMGMWIESGEGDPIDIFLCKSL